MNYPNVARAVFLSRPNRFIARVELDGRTEAVHVKNTGRCRELLVPGAEVTLTEPGTPGRRTRYDLITVRKGNGVLFNLDSQAPNRVVREWLDTLECDRILPEYQYGASRLDFCMEKGGRQYLMEVKGCTLEVDGIGYFPDAPTERGTRHLRELTEAIKAGYRCAIAFVIQMDDVTEVRANRATDPAFADALEEAQRTGVRTLFLPCHVEADSIAVVRSLCPDPFA